MLVKIHFVNFCDIVKLRGTPKAKRYQGDIEIYDWLRQELKYGKNPYRLGDPQPSS
jgi:hypothetical protein